MNRQPITGLDDMIERLQDERHDPSMSPEDYEDLQELEAIRKARQRAATPTKSMRRYV